MKRIIASAVVVLAAVLTVGGCGHVMQSQGWTTLIDGEKGMDNWYVTGSGGNWRAAEGAIQADKLTSGKGASVLASKKTFKDFELRVEFWAADETNSGVYVRAPDPKTINTASGAYEVQIWDRNPNAMYSTGSLVNVAAVAPVHKAGGKWNTFEITARGAEITVKMNGVTTAHITDGKNTGEGRIGLQFNGGPIKFRKLQVREL
jgi:hypothetical protein